MYNNTKILDVHGHIVASPQFSQYDRALWTLRHGRQALFLVF